MDPRAALSEAKPKPFWLDQATTPDRRPPQCGGSTVDLVIVGAGFTGLWAAIQAVEDNPDLSVIVIDSGRIGAQASGRNGGFCSSSLTHGLENGHSRFPQEMSRLDALAEQNFAGIRDAIQRYDIECGWEETGSLSVATQPWCVDGLLESAELEREYGHSVEVLSAEDTRALVNSPTYLGALRTTDGEALVDPARLAWGLASAAEALGVVLHEDTPMLSLEQTRAGMAVRTASGTIQCAKVILATNAFKSPVKAINRMIAPVYDYVLMTQPLTDQQMDEIGWKGREGLSDRTNLFHYYRLTEDNRILWGGYDAVYHYGSKIDPSLDISDETHATLATHFYDTFPQLEDVGFSHRWGGVIDTCSRFSVSFGTAFDRRVAYAVGYTGLGVGATRFGARVCLDLLGHPDSDLLNLQLVRKKPIPFPPEPIRWMGIELTRRAVAKSDANGGRRGPWLSLLDAVGLGFDS